MSPNAIWLDGGPIQFFADSNFNQTFLSRIWADEVESSVANYAYVDSPSERKTAVKSSPPSTVDAIRR